jgi:putative glutamine amidotransferase
MPVTLHSGTTIMSQRLPLIGITTDRAGHPEEEDESAYVVRRNYADAIARAGGMAVILPYDPLRAADYIDRIDGLLVTGGRFDLPPDWYGAETSAAPLVLKIDRSEAERALVTAALAVDLPILGICNGMQLLGVLHGASLIGHIPSDIASPLVHMNPARPGDRQHDVHIAEHSQLRVIAGTASAAVNSVHHQAVRPSSGLHVSAIASDGVVEAIEVPGRRFCIGVQWHPEYAVDSADTRLFEAFVTAATDHRARRAERALA